MRPFFSSMALLSLLLTGCSGNAELPPLPEGEQTVIGILRPAPLSAVRRGSHFIEQDGVNIYYVESTLINLREYQEKRVTLRGFLEHNTDTENLPVLVAHTVADVEEANQEHILSGIGVRLTVPVQWNLASREGQYQFRLEGEEEILLTVWQDDGSELPEGGVPVVVDATRATRLIDGLSGTQIVAVKRSASILQFRFSPGQRMHADRLSEQFIEVLKSVDLLSEDAASASVPSSGTGALGVPCGGTAGILCPSGSYCDIQDFTENIGRCRRL